MLCVVQVGYVTDVQYWGVLCVVQVGYVTDVQYWGVLCVVQVGYVTDVQYWGVLCVVQVGYGLGINCSCVCLFLCSVICSAGQRATVQRESELGVRGPE